MQSWAEDVRMDTRLTNVRSETAHSKPSFGAAFRDNYNRAVLRLTESDPISLDTELA